MVREQLTAPAAGRLTDRPDWSRLIEEALTMPGSLGNTYSRFYDYSFNNQVLLWLQGVNEPVATYKRWQAMGRQVKRGSKARAIWRPNTRRVTDEESGETVTRLTGFKLVHCLFPVSDTEGEPLPEVATPTWDRDRALGGLAVRQVPFAQLNGNIAGYSVGRDFAINPVAVHPAKTTFHELAHIVLGHTADPASYVQHRGVHEFQAEATAYLSMNELEALTADEASESRGYIQAWLRGADRPGDEAIRQVFTATDRILRAGRAQSGGDAPEAES